MVGERRFTRALATFFAPPTGPGALGIGDDAAVVVNRGRHTVAACDPVVEGVHFTAQASLAAVGRKVVNRNLADLAAMGARFDYALVSILWPRRRPARELRALLRGIRAAVEGQGGVVVGGDTGATPGPLTVTVTVLGHLRHRALRRDGARAGDAIFVSGPLGGSILGQHLRFVPPLALGEQLAARPAVSAAMDVSDGLALDLATLLAASASRLRRPLGAELDAAAIPVSSAARRLARQTGQSPLRHALGDGEDHELLFTVRGGARWSAAGLPAAARRPIGRVVERPGLWLRDGTKLTPLRAMGFEHGLGR